MHDFFCPQRLRFFLVKEIAWFFCLKRFNDFFVQKDCIIFFCPERLRDFFCPKRLGDFFCPERLSDFFCPERLGDFFLSWEVGWFFCPKRLGDLFLFQEVWWFFVPRVWVIFFVLRGWVICFFVPRGLVICFIASKNDTFSFSYDKLYTKQVLRSTFSEIWALPTPNTPLNVYWHKICVDKFSWLMKPGYIIYYFLLNWTELKSPSTKFSTLSTYLFTEFQCISGDVHMFVFMSSLLNFLLERAGDV